MTYTHDWIEFFRPYVYNSVKGINDHREFIIRKRADGCKLSPYVTVVSISLS